MPALSVFVTSLTQDRFLPKVVDQVFNGNVLGMRLLKSARSWMGGSPLQLPVNITSRTNVGSYFGFDTFSTTQESSRQLASFNPSQIQAGLALSGIQKAINQGEPAVINLVATEVELAGKMLKDEFGTELYADGTGNASKDILGLGAAVDDSTSITTYANLSRSTYTNWRATRTAQSGSLSLANLAADFDAAQRGDDTPTLMVSTPAVFTIYESLMTPTVSHQFSMNDFRMTGDGMVKVGGTVAANQGFRALTFRGIPFVSDEKCTSGYIYTLNENHLFLYSIPQPEREVKNNFAWTGWKEGINQDAVVSQLLWYGQLVTDSPRTHAVRTGVTS